MPISYRIDEDKKRVYSRAEGRISYDDMRRHMNAEAGEPSASYSEIFDCTGATTSLTTSDVQALASERRILAQRQLPGPVAVVATTNVFFGMLRMYDSLTSQIRPLRVFRDADKATEWLDSLTGNTSAY